MNNTIVGLKLKGIAKGERGFRVVGADRNACPYHFGIFPIKADAEALACELNANPTPANPNGYKVKAFTASRTS